MKAENAQVPRKAANIADKKPKTCWDLWKTWRDPENAKALREAASIANLPKTRREMRSEHRHHEARNISKAAHEGPNATMAAAFLSIWASMGLEPKLFEPKWLLEPNWLRRGCLAVLGPSVRGVPPRVPQGSPEAK